MSPLQGTWIEFRDAVRAFSRPAKLYLLTEFMAWVGHGIFSVLFNLYLVEGGFSEAFVGTAISAQAVGLALVALPAGLLADRWGRRRCLMLGAVLDGVGAALRVSTLNPAIIIGASFLAGAGQSMLAIAAAPFITEHSTPKERTHLFSSFFACALLAGVAGNILGGLMPKALLALPGAWHPSTMLSYRSVLLLGATIVLCGWFPLSRLRGLVERPVAHREAPAPPEATQRLVPIAFNSALIGLGAGFVIPFMNLYFKDRFHCSSAQIGVFFSIAQIMTAIASLLAPAAARRFGKLRAAVGSELMSLPFLVTLGAERRLDVAVSAFWLRATFMQASTPLLQSFVMEALPHNLRARSSSINNMVWNIGWAVSSTCAGIVIQHFGYAVPFYLTAGLYATAATTFFLAFRKLPEHSGEVRVTEEAKGSRGEGTLSD